MPDLLPSEVQEVRSLAGEVVPDEGGLHPEVLAPDGVLGEALVEGQQVETVRVRAVLGLVMAAGLAGQAGTLHAGAGDQAGEGGGGESVERALHQPQDLLAQVRRRRPGVGTALRQLLDTTNIDLYYL